MDAPPPGVGCERRAPRCASSAPSLIQPGVPNEYEIDLGYCIGHLSEILRDPTAELHKRIAKTGAFVGFDTVGHFLPHSPEQTDAMRVKMVVALIEAGYEDQILLSSDLGRTPDLKANWGSGYSTVVTVFVPKLRYAGVKEATIQKILVDNPRRFLAFVPKSV